MLDTLLDFLFIFTGHFNTGGSRLGCGCIFIVLLIIVVAVMMRFLPVL